MPNTASSLAAGFDVPVHQSQQAFRRAMDAFSRPCQPVMLETNLTPPAPLLPAAAALGLALLDFEVNFYLSPSLAQNGAIAEFFRFHTGAAQTDNPAKAAFAFLDLSADALALAAFGQGIPDYPDRSTTIIAMAQGFDVSGGFTATGPGIDGAARLAITPLPADFSAQWAHNRASFPLGVDLVFVAGAEIVGLPRSTTLTGENA